MKQEIKEMLASIMVVALTIIFPVYFLSSAASFNGHTNYSKTLNLAVKKIN